MNYDTTTLTEQGSSPVKKTDYLQRTVGATISTSKAYTPQRNTIAERKFRTLGEMAKAMLYDSS